jgi:ribosomal protein L20A (L18A)
VTDAARPTNLYKAFNEVKQQVVLVMFSVTGKAELAKGTQPFEREVEAESEEHARELIYNHFGSKNRLSRANVHIEDIEQVEQ